MRAPESQNEFESLVKLLAPESIISKEDIEIMKNKVFGFNTFWVTGNPLTPFRPTIPVMRIRNSHG